MSFGRLIVPPVVGASTSLALLYLYHQANLSRHQTLQDAIAHTRESIQDAEESVRDRLRGTSRGAFAPSPTANASTPPQAAEGAGNQEQGRQDQADWGAPSRFREKRYMSVAEQIKDRWNYHLLHLPSNLSSIQGDTVVLTTLATITNYTRALISSISGINKSATEAEDKAGDVVAQLKGATSRSKDEFLSKVDELKSTSR